MFRGGAFNQEKTPENNRTNHNHADGGFDLNPKSRPYVVIRTHDADGDNAGQVDSDHEET